MQNGQAGVIAGEFPAEEGRGVDKAAEGAATGLLPERIADQLRHLIVTELLPGGARIRERELSERLSVSRTPLREALKLLAADGLVSLLPNRGAVVAQMSVADIEEKLGLLGLLEGYAGRLVVTAASAPAVSEIRALHFEMRAAYERGDRTGYFLLNQSIHNAIVAATGNRTLVETHARLNRQLYRYRFNGSLTATIWETAMAEHEEIVRLLTVRDGSGLERILNLHVGSTWRALRADETTSE